MRSYHQLTKAQGFQTSALRTLGHTYEEIARVKSMSFLSELQY
jgi:hypothetical protein